VIDSVKALARAPARVQVLAQVQERALPPALAQALPPALAQA